MEGGSLRVNDEGWLTERCGRAHAHLGLMPSIFIRAVSTWAISARRGSVLGINAGACIVPTGVHLCLAERDHVRVAPPVVCDGPSSGVCSFQPTVAT